MNWFFQYKPNTVGAAAARPAPNLDADCAAKFLRAGETILLESERMRWATLQLKPLWMAFELQPSKQAPNAATNTKWLR